MPSATVGKLSILLSADSRQLSAGLDRARKRLNRFGRVINRAGARVARFGVVLSAAAAGGLALAIREGAAFEQRMKGVEVASQSTTQEMAKLEKQARMLGSTTQFSATQAAQAMEEFAKAGLSTRQTLDAIGPALTIAASGELAIADAAGVAVRTLKQFELQASDINRVADTMVTTFQNSLTTVQELGNAMRFAGAFAKQAGFSFEETSAAIGLMQDAGLQATQAGRNLRQILIKMIQPTKEGQEVLDRFGIQLKDAEGNMKSLSGILEEFETKMAGLNRTARAAELSKIFPAEAVGGFISLLQQGSAEVDAFLEKFRVDTGRAADVAEKKLNTLQGAFIRVKSAAGELAIAITEALGPEIRRQVNAFTDVIRRLGSIVKTNTDDIKSGISALKDTFVSGFDTMIRLVRFFQGAWFGLKASIAGVLGLVIRVVQRMVDVFVEGINKALAAVEALAFAIPGIPDKLGETARDARQRLEAITGGFDGFVDGLADTFERAGDKSAQAFADAFAAQSPSEKIAQALDFPAPIDLTRPGGGGGRPDFPNFSVPGRTGRITGAEGLLQGALNAMTPSVNLRRDAARNQMISEQVNASQAIADAVMRQQSDIRGLTDSQNRAMLNIGRAVQRQAMEATRRPVEPQTAELLRSSSAEAERRAFQAQRRVLSIDEKQLNESEKQTRALKAIRRKLNEDQFQVVTNSIN